MIRVKVVPSAVKQYMRKTMMALPGVSYFRKKLDNQYERDEFVMHQLNELSADSAILDAGCGSQRYRKYCSHLKYKSQDFGQYTTDVKAMIGTKGIGGEAGYSYGQLDYMGNIWNVDEEGCSI